MLNFFGIGAQKAGTTWLHQHLNSHPDIWLHPQKEIHFWDWHYDNGVEWYKSLFAGEVKGQIKGEITPAYAILPTKKIQEAYNNFPDAKLIYMVRNPIDRAWSSALMALGRAEMTFAEASDQWFIDHFYSEGSLKRGDYKSCIKNWLQFYPATSLLVCDFNDIKNNPSELLQACCKHIAIDGSFYAGSYAKDLNKKVFATSGQTIRPRLKHVLEDIYYDQIEYVEKELF